MEATGKILNISMSYPSRNAVVSMEMTARCEDIEKYKGMNLTVTINQFKEKRSLSANAYFHKLCDEIRKALGTSMASVKNDLITTYGQIWYLPDGEQWIYKTNAPLELVMELEDHHLKFIREDPHDEGVFWYRVYRGSHTYNTKEMSILIDGTVAEAKGLGIETLTPDEQKKLIMAWEKYL